VIVVEVRRENPLQVSIVENDHVVKTFSANRSDHAFTVGVLPRRSGCGENFFNAHVLHTILKVRAVAAIAIPDEIRRRLIPGKRFRDLLSRSACRGIRRDVEVDHSTAIVAEDDETVQDSKCGSGTVKKSMPTRSLR
jgi:hypothetical protein